MMLLVAQLVAWVLPMALRPQASKNTNHSHVMTARHYSPQQHGWIVRLLLNVSQLWWRVTWWHGVPPMALRPHAGTSTHQHTCCPATQQLMNPRETRAMQS